MNENELLNRLNKLKDEVKANLRKNGVVTPVKTSKGIRLDDYEIILVKSGYQILNKWREVEVDNVNYLQTAVMVANSLALKKHIPSNIIFEDMKAGAAEFDVKIFEKRFDKSLKNKDMFGVQHYSIRLWETKNRFKSHFNEIDKQYKRLMNNLQASKKTNK